MKRIITVLSLLTVILFQSCSVFSGMSLEEKKAKEAQVAAAIANLDFTIEVDEIHPMGGTPIHSLGEYSVSFKDGKATSYLPFFGTSRSFTYGSNDSGIKFKDLPVTPNVYSSPKKKGLTIIEFQAKSFEDTWLVVIEIWNNGRATIACTTRDKSPMHYDGELSFREEKK